MMAEKRTSMRSRVITGFHRLGILLAIPLLVGAIGTAISAWFSDNGPYVPDPSTTPPLQVTLQSKASDLKKFTNDELWLAKATVGAQAWSFG
jgi:hypothetical protein